MIVKLAIMQPYFFPYIGYFQLINAVDKFVLYDDVNYIKKGWINRNRILADGAAGFFVLPCKKASQNKLINEIETLLDQKEKEKLLKRFYHAYHHAPQFEAVFNLIEQALTREARTIAQLAAESILAVCKFLDIETEIIPSSSVFQNRGLKKADRLIDICWQLNAHDYINAAGGTAIYTKDYFLESGIHLYFLESRPIAYRQFGQPFVPWLSIIDVLMFNKKEQCKSFLNEYDLQ
jgi:hypothetical protein